LTTITDWPHQGLGNVPLPGGSTPGTIEDHNLDDIVCHEAMGGLLKHYERRAA
jgi:hypothetical protein